MKDNFKRGILEALGCNVPLRQHRSGWFVSSCPFGFAKHNGGVSEGETFGISESNIYSCFSCGEKGHVDLLVQEVATLRKAYGSTAFVDLKEANALLAQSEQEDAEEGLHCDDLPDFEEPVALEVDAIFSEKWLDTFKPAEKFSAARKYMKSRGITREMCQRLDLRYDTQDCRICFPVRNWDGKLVGLHGRAVEKGNPLRYKVYKYEGKHNTNRVWYGEQWAASNKNVVFVESVFDVASVLRVYPNVMCPLSAGLSSDKIKRVQSFMGVCTIFDHGTGGDTARRSLERHLPDAVMHHYVPTEEEKDPGDMSEERIKEVVDHLLELTNGIEPF